MIAGVLLAAGESRRFGGQKLLEDWRGEPLVARAARSMLLGGLDPVVVVIPPVAAIRQALRHLELTLVENDEPRRGISHSIALGVGSLGASAEAALLAVADQPLMDEVLVARLCAAYLPGAIVTPRYGSNQGNPRLFDRRYFAELTRLAGDAGGQVVAAAHPEVVIECLFPERSGLDIDRPEDLPGLLG
ncbi:MAG: molybdenum cofactor cytidylyltransferase [Chloroflexota bacterium]|nr:molybdenum cofactor cytidylyltransferase [Chloroflexota bacterium]